MNYDLPFLPKRQSKPRTQGVNMVMDKGLSLRQAEDMIESCGELIDIVKLGFGTSMVCPNLKDKIKFYQDNDVNVYFGGTLFEAFLIRGMVDDYKKYLDQFGITTVEVSDGSIAIAHDHKLKLIHDFKKDYQVLSEVGSKQNGIIIPPDEWIKMMNSELEAGSWKVIAEARESGTVGIYNADGSANMQLINFISSKVDPAKILWEAPDGKQQIFFIKTQGPQVNLGNLAPSMVVPVETIRLGLRGDTLLDYVPKESQDAWKQHVFVNPVIDFQI